MANDSWRKYKSNHCVYRTLLQRNHGRIPIFPDWLKNPTARRKQIYNQMLINKSNWKHHNSLSWCLWCQRRPYYPSSQAYSFSLMERSLGTIKLKLRWAYKLLRWTGWLFTVINWQNKQEWNKNSRKNNDSLSCRSWSYWNSHFDSKCINRHQISNSLKHTENRPTNFNFFNRKTAAWTAGRSCISEVIISIHIQIYSKMDAKYKTNRQTSRNLKRIFENWPNSR